MGCKQKAMQFQSRHYKPKKKRIPVAAKPPVHHVAGVPIENVIEPCRRPGLTPLSEREPELALEWYYPKNCGFGPEDFSYGSQVAAWWQCKLNKKHIWRGLCQNVDVHYVSGTTQTEDLSSKSDRLLTFVLSLLENGILR